MGAFHQVGHDSENLLFEKELDEFAGAILSPLNYDPSEVINQLSRLRGREHFKTIFDPHLYRPKSDRGCLPKWGYYPKDVDTADFTAGWLAGVVDQLAATAIEVAPSAVASPAIIPRSFSDEFYVQLVESGDRLQTSLGTTKIKPMLTAVANFPDLASPARVMAIASILSRSKVEDCLLVLMGDTEPRRELSEIEELKGAMKLIQVLERSGQRITVCACSSDLVLWKAAGATHCASGKFFNLRRFTLSRFDEPGDGGGGQLAYWFEEALLSFLRQSDLLRVQSKGMLSEASVANPLSQKILDCIPQNKAWVGLGWRHFLYWFADAERRLREGLVSAAEMVQTADENWGKLETAKPRVFMEERQNTGEWVRQWRRALEEFPYFT
jgi:hypothetical protein